VTSTTIWRGQDHAVFDVSTSGKDDVLHTFRRNTDVYGPLGGLTALNGVLYGTTYSYGGAVFSVTLPWLLLALDNNRLGGQQVRKLIFF
jgi:hypothetical protein